MKALFVPFVCLTMLMVGCGRSHYEQMSKYHDDGRAKPVVVFTSIYDRNGIELPWKLSDDLSFTIKNRLAKRSNMYIISDAHLVSLEQHIQAGENPFIGDANWMKSAYSDGEFVAFLELIEHKIHPKQSGRSLFDVITPSYLLDMTMRVRVFDLRGAKPEIVLQEIVKQSHMIPRQIARMDFKKAKWGKKAYGISPLGLAHGHLLKEVGRRIEDYVLLAKSHSHAR